LDPKLKELYSNLVQQDSYRSFLGCYFQWKKEHVYAFSYARFSTQLGLQSKSSIRDILTGRRRLTVATFHKILKSLDLPSLLSQYFSLLVQEEEGFDLLDPPPNKELLKDKIKDSLHQIELPVSVLENKQIPYLYSCLGNKDRGVSLPELSKLSGLSEQKMSETLEQMVKLGITRINEQGNYVAVNFHLKVNSNSELEIYNQYFATMTKLVGEKVIKNDPLDIYQNTSILIDKEQLSDFKRDLSKSLEDLIQKYETPYGDQVVDLLSYLGPLGRN
jgi:transcriptional regulator with XRE-family HTH domain